MELILRNARIAGDEDSTVDIGIEAGRFAAIAPDLAAEGEDRSAKCAKTGITYEVKGFWRSLGVVNVCCLH